MANIELITWLLTHYDTYTDDNTKNNSISSTNIRDIKSNNGKTALDWYETHTHGTSDRDRVKSLLNSS